MYHDNFFSLFSVDAQLAGAYTVTRHDGNATARYHGYDVTLTTGDTFDIERDDRKVGHGFNNGVNIVATIDGATRRADSLDAILDHARR